MTKQYTINKWNKIGLSTEPMNRNKVQDAIYQVYKQSKLPIPKDGICWCDSPLEIIKRGYDLPTGLSIANTIYYDKVPDAKIASYWMTTVELRQLQRTTFLVSSIYLALRASLSADSKGCHQLVRVPLINRIIGFFASIDKKKKRSFLRPFMTIMEEVDYWSPFENICFVSERPNLIQIENGRLHSEIGPAVSYRDGTSLYLINGVLLDEQIIMRPETQSSYEIRFEPNTEIKRIRIERYGWERYVIDCGLEVVDSRKNDVECTLESLVKVYDRQAMCALICHCPSTGRIYTMEVPIFIKTCQEAQNYLWGGSNLQRINKLNILGRS